MEYEDAYLAGFLDGEGCFRPHGKHVNPCIQCTNTYLPVLQRLCRRFGGSIAYNRTTRDRGQKLSWQWRIYGDKAVACCRELLPYLEEKRQQALDVISLSFYPPRSAMRAYLKKRLSALKRSGQRLSDCHHQGPVKLTRSDR